MTRLFWDGAGAVPKWVRIAPLLPRFRRPVNSPVGPSTPPYRNTLRDNIHVDACVDVFVVLALASESARSGREWMIGNENEIGKEGNA